MKFPCIAIDGPAAVGKGTLASRLAAHYNLAHLDSGLLYRAVAYNILKYEYDPKNTEMCVRAVNNLEITKFDFNNPTLRSEETGKIASIIAAKSEVRKLLLNFQRDFAKCPSKNKKGTIIDGRDIGTVVVPDASLKFFVTASLHVRSQRRIEELSSKGFDTIGLNIEGEMEARDRRDTQRKESPLRIAEDAEVIDTSELSKEEVFLVACKIIEEKLPILSL